MKHLLFASILAVSAGAAHAAEPTTFHRISKAFVSVYLIQVPDGAVLVDAHNAGSAEWILRELDELGVSEGELDLILLTHGHHDHAGSAAALRELTGAPIAVGLGDVAMVEQGVEISAAEVATGFRGRLLAAVINTELETFTPDLVVEDTLDLSEYGVAATARVVGGHTQGSLIVTLDSGEVLIGDLVRGGMLRRHKPTLHFFHEDMAVAHAALGEVLDTEPTQVCAAHDRCLSPERTQRWLDRRSK